jgi:hypothetical protein
MAPTFSGLFFQNAVVQLQDIPGLTFPGFRSPERKSDIGVVAG